MSQLQHNPISNKKKSSQSPRRAGVTQMPPILCSYCLQVRVNNKIISALFNQYSYLFIDLGHQLMSQQEFEAAANRIKHDLEGKKPSDDELLVLYGWFKQANEGDADPKNKPGTFSLDFKGKAKYGAWEKVKGKSKEEARAEYIAAANKILEKYHG